MTVIGRLGKDCAPASIAAVAAMTAARARKPGSRNRSTGIVYSFNSGQFTVLPALMQYTRFYMRRGEFARIYRLRTKGGRTANNGMQGRHRPIDLTMRQG